MTLTVTETVGFTETSTTVLHSALRTPARRRGPGRAAESRLQQFHTLPDHLADNEFIRDYYRADYSIKESLRSFFQIHNETGNIWTHFLGFLLFAALTVILIRSRPIPLDRGNDRFAPLEQDTYQQGRSGLLGILRAETYSEHQLRLAGVHVETLLVEHEKAGIDTLWQVESETASPGNRVLTELAQHRHESLNPLERLGASVKAMGEIGLEEAGRELHDLEQRLMRQTAGVFTLTWPVPRWPVYLFLFGCMTCLLTSSMCHLLGCCKAHVVPWVWRADYAAIVLFIVTSYVAPLYYSLVCKPTLRLFYLATTVALGAMVFVVCLLPFFQQVQFRAFRAALFVALGSWGFVPASHILLTSGEPAVVSAMWHAVVMGLLYMLGAVIYASRVPERWWPGTFDLLLHSHQLFHVCAVAAALVHYRGILLLLNWQDSVGGCTV